MEVVGVADHRLSAQGAPLLVVASLATRLLLKRECLTCGDGMTPPVMTRVRYREGGASGDACVEEDQLHVVGAAEVEVLAHHPLEEYASLHRALEDLRQGELRLRHRDVVGMPAARPAPVNGCGRPLRRVAGVDFAGPRGMSRDRGAGGGIVAVLQKGVRACRTASESGLPLAAAHGRRSTAPWTGGALLGTPAPGAWTRSLRSRSRRGRPTATADRGSERSAFREEARLPNTRSTCSADVPTRTPGPRRSSAPQCR